MTIPGLFPGYIVLLVCISAIIDFDVLRTLWVFKVDVSLFEKLGVDYYSSMLKHRYECIVNFIVNNAKV